MNITHQQASQIASLIDGRLVGNPAHLVKSIDKIDNKRSGALCFLANPRYEKFLYEGRDMVVLVDQDFMPKKDCTSTLIYVNDVYGSFSKVLQTYSDDSEKIGRIDALASVDETAILGHAVSIGKFTVIKEGSTIGDGAEISDQVFIGENVEIGSRAKIYPGVKIYASCKIGNEAIIHANAVVGSDGFGYSKISEQFDKIPQVGNVIIEDSVEIGSGTTIDRATFGSTIIKKGAKLDNLIQVGHNVVIGENAVIAAQSGIAGSSEIGEGSQIGGQVGIAGHIKIAPNTMIQAKSGVASSIDEKGKKWYGYPILPYRQYLKSYSVFKKLPELLKRIRVLEKKSCQQ